MTTSTPEPTIKVREGDVYLFRYSDAEWERANKHHRDLHWCFDGKLIMRDGHLCDTYWGLSWGGDTGRYFTLADAQAAGELTFVCNINDVEKIREDEYELYADGDAFNLTHQHGCYKHFVKRLGAKKDRQRMLDALNRKVAEARKEMERAVSHLEYAVLRREQLTPRIEAGEEPSL